MIAIPLAGCVPNVYAATVTIGNTQSFELLLDTGSTTLGVAAQGCQTCLDAGVSELYEPGASAIDEGMTVNAGYGALSPSGWSGEIYEDWVGVQAEPELARVKFGAMSEQKEFLVADCGAAGVAEGLIGMAQAPIALTGTNGFFDQVVATGVVPNIFATRLCSDDGTLWLGGYDPNATTGPPVYTPMILTEPGGTGTAEYVVNLVSISASGTSVPIASADFPGTFLDTGASIWSIPPDALSALAGAISSSPSFEQIFGAEASAFFSSVDNQVELAQTKAQLDEALPPLTLTFGSAPTVSIQAPATESYLVTYGGGVWSPALTSRAPDNATYPGIAAILGPPVLRSSVVIFDRANQQIGFAPKVPCP